MLCSCLDTHSLSHHGPIILLITILQQQKSKIFVQISNSKTEAHCGIQTLSSRNTDCLIIPCTVCHVMKQLFKYQKWFSFNLNECYAAKWFQLLPLNLQPHIDFLVLHISGFKRVNSIFTFQFVVFRVCRKQDIREELLEAVASIPRPVLHIGPHRLVELHQELLRRCSQLLDHLIPLVNILRLQH